MKSFNFLATTGLVGVLAAGLPVQVVAQASDPGAAASASDLDTVVVTARKREENLIDVPLPVSVATQAQLVRDKVYSITDLQRVTPALEVSQTSGGEVNGGARLRGLGTGVFNASVSPSVAFVVDQVPQGNLAFPLLFDLAQVEVLRGPQGTLFGQGASAGVINVTSVAPTLSGIKVSSGIDYSNKGSFGSEVGEMTVRAALNLPLGERTALRVATQLRKEDGLQRNTFLDLDNEVNDLGIRARLLVEASDSVTVNVSAEHVRTTMDGWNFFAVATTPTSTAPFDPDGPGPTPVIGTVGGISTGSHLNPNGCGIPVISDRAEFYCEDAQARMVNTASGVSAAVDWNVSDALTVSSITALRSSNRETETVNFSRRLDVAARNENVESDSKQLSEELRFSYEGSRVDLVAGAMYSKFQIEATPIRNVPLGQRVLGGRTGFSVCANSGAFCVVPVALSYEDTENSIFAVFADATTPLTEQLDLFGGLRYSDYRNTTGVGSNVLVATRTSKVSDSDVSGRVGLSFKPAAGSTIYASVARGYKPPAIVVPTIATSPVTALKPETASAFEIGAKRQVGRLQLSGNIFLSKVKDFQTQSSVFDSAGALISVTQNIASVKSKGLELGVFGEVTRNFSVNAGYQFNDVEFPAGFVGNDGVSLAGKQFVNAPKHKFTLSGEYGAPVAGGVEMFMNANVVYKSDVLLGQYGGAAFRYGAHEILNLGLGVRDADGKWRASLFVRNLTGEREPTAYLAGDFAGNSDGSLRAWPVAGLTARVVGISADFNF